MRFERVYLHLQSVLTGMTHFVSVPALLHLLAYPELVCGSFGLGPFNGSGALLVPGALCTLIHAILPTTPQGGSVIRVPISHMRKLRHRELKKLAPVFTVR